MSLGGLISNEKFFSENGLRDLLEDNMSKEDMLYPIIHLRGTDIEVAITHSKTQYSEEYHSFVNGQNTTQGGTHQAAFRESLVKTIREFYGKNYEASDIRKSIVSAFWTTPSGWWARTGWSRATPCCSPPRSSPGHRPRW